MTSTPRNHVIDCVRAWCVLVVVVFHALLYQVVLVDGAPTLVPWAPPHWPWWPITWFAMPIPLFFLAGGFANAVVVDKLSARGASYGHFLAERGRRLIGPLLFFVTVMTVLFTAAAWLGYLDAAATLSPQLMQLLWFLAVYLVICAAAPCAVRAHDRWGWRPLAVLLVLGALVDAWSFHAGNADLRNLNMLTVWPLVHQLGIAYHRGWFRTGPAWRSWVPVLAGAGGIAVLIFGFGYPGTSVGLADLPIANVQPPTIAMAFLGLANAGVLGLIERTGWLNRLAPGVERVVSVVNALMMSVYLWHILCIGLAGLLLVTLARLAPAASGVLLAQVTVAVVAVAMVALVVPQIARLEARLVAPLGSHPRTSQAVLAYGVLIAGTVLVWRYGTVLHPSQPGAIAGVTLVWAGVALMHRAARGDGRPAGSQDARPNLDA